eukprot:m.534130 g.534130  ORF g.534130 m.534130 type:complete len:52 (+) comp22052_c0_seq36:2843-2998(+)
MRTSFEPYIMEQMALVSQTGLPINRPLWFDFPDDAASWGITKQDPRTWLRR